MEHIARPKFAVRKHPEFKRFFSSGVFGGHTPYEFKMIVYQEGYEDVTEGTVTGKEPPVILRELQAEITIPAPPVREDEPARPPEGMYG
jgi:hypothetical protein